MSAKKIYVNKERVALAEDINCRGYIDSVMTPYTPGDVTMYNVQWDKHGCYLYLGDALISEKEAVELTAKRDAEKKSIEDAQAKFKAMEGKLEADK